MNSRQLKSTMPWQRSHVLATGLVLVFLLSIAWSATLVYFSTLVTVRSKQDPPTRQDGPPAARQDHPPASRVTRIPPPQAIKKERNPLLTVPSSEGLDCKAYGGPADAKEMMYWRHVPSDYKYLPPFYNSRNTKIQRFLTFDATEGAFNNKRWALETVLVLAVATGRTLVLPPPEYMMLLEHGDQSFSFTDFFELTSLPVITMEEFLEKHAMKGKMWDVTGHVSYPPHNRTNWDKATREEQEELYEWLKWVTLRIPWDHSFCSVLFPARSSHKDLKALKRLPDSIDYPDLEDYEGRPVPVNASIKERLKEGGYRECCVYDDVMQQAPVIHLASDIRLGRLTVPFYGFVFFEDWKQDLWFKRLVRDRLRYRNELQCAAARIVKALRKRARQRDPSGNPKGVFDSFHVRRGDFQEDAWIDGATLYKRTKSKLVRNATVYVATDERDKSYFDALRRRYDVVFLDDFLHLLGDLNPNYYGMIDQLVAAKGRVFFGCSLSTFTGYILRLRGYYANKNKLPGYEDGIHKSWFYAPEENLDMMQKYMPAHDEPWHTREYPTSWRLIDKGIGKLHDTT